MKIKALFLLHVLWTITLHAKIDRDAPFALHLAFREPTSHTTAMKTIESREMLYVAQKPTLGSADVRELKVVDRSPAASAAVFVLTDEGATKLESLTRSHKGKNLAIILDGQLWKAPQIRETIRGHEWIVEGIPLEKLQSVATALKGNLTSRPTESGKTANIEPIK